MSDKRKELQKEADKLEVTLQNYFMFELKLPQHQCRKIYEMCMKHTNLNLQIAVETIKKNK